MTHALRPYQRRNRDEILGLLARGVPSILYVLPTRGGKTVVATEVQKALHALNWDQVFCVHRQELLHQASDHLTRLGLPHGVVGPGSTWTSHRLHVASIDTMKARLHEAETARRLARMHLAIPDEGHHAEADGWARVIGAVGGQVLGLTATPGRMDGKGLGNTYSEVVWGPSIKRLIADGYLVQPETFAPSTTSMQGVRKVAGDYSRAAAAALVDTDDITRLAVRSYARFRPGAPSVWFCVTVEHARKVAEAFRKAGWRAAHVDGGMSDRDRERAIYGLADRSVHVLTSCEIISEGTDLPYVGVAGLLRPTASTALYMQQGGRVLTPHADKTRCTIFDFVGNWTRHGLVDQDRQWSLETGVVGAERQVAALRRCGHCHRVAEAGPAACPTCGAAYRKGFSRWTDAELAAMGSAGGVPMTDVAAMGWDDFRKLCETLTSRREVAAVARVRGYDNEWVERQLSRCA